MKRWISGNKLHIKQNQWLYAASFLLPFAICLLICICNGVYPFGSRCLLHVDMYHQYCPFFTEFMDKLKTGGSLMYSWRLGLGSDFVSLYAYYLASPLNWLLILCPRAYVIEFMSLLILLKIAASGFSFFFFLKEHYHLYGKDGLFHGNTAYPALVFSTAYALSGFVAAYSWDIMWLDSIALFPLIMTGLERLVKSGRVLLYTVSLAVCIWANYYISIMICIFLVFYFALLIVREGRPDASKAGKKRRWRLPALGRFTLCSALAGASCAVLLLPEIAVLGASGSVDGGFPETAEWYFSILAELGRGAAAKVYTGNSHWPNLYAGAFSLVLVWVYLFNRRIPWKEKLPRVLMLGFFLVSFANNQLDYIWHGMHFPQSLPGRQSFLYIFLLLSMGFAAVRKWRGIRPWQAVVSVVAALVLLLAASIAGDAEVTEPSALFITALLCMLYGMYLLLMRLVSSRCRHILFVLALCTAVFELALNMALTGFSVTSRTAYMEKQEDYAKLTALANKREAGAFYRMEDTGRKTKNDSALYGYASTTIFSSLMNLELSHFYQSLYLEGGKNFYSYNGATPLTSALLSVRYYLSDSPMEENAFRRLVAQAGGSYLYENVYTLPLGYVLEDALAEDWTPDRQNRIGSLNALAFALGAGEEMIRACYCEQAVDAGTTSIQFPEDGYYYAAYDTCSADNLTVSRSDGWSQTYAKTTHRYLIALGDCESGEQAWIKNAKGERISFTVYRLNEQAVEEAYAALSRQTFEPDEVTDTSIRGSIRVEQAGRLVFAVPADAGWRVYVDGEQKEIEPWQDALIGVALTEGVHEIRLVYQTPYLKTGAAVSCLCVLLFGVYALRLNGRNKNLWKDH